MTVPEHPKGSLGHGNIADELARGQQNLEVVVVSPAGEIPITLDWTTAVTARRGLIRRDCISSLFRNPEITSGLPFISAR